jgi:hypothetical protein
MAQLVSYEKFFCEYGSCRQHLFLFIIYECAHKARVLNYIKMESFARDKYSGLLGPFVNYEEN